MSSATTSLSYRHIFGINGAIADNITYSDEDTILYIAGHNAVLYNKIENKQRFIYGSEGSEGICSFVCSPGKRYIAVSERGDKGAQINVYDLKTFRKRKNLTSSGISSKVCNPLIYFYFV
jgi:Tol biopolymer transport system component